MVKAERLSELEHQYTEDRLLLDKLNEEGRALQEKVNRTARRIAETAIRIDELKREE